MNRNFCIAALWHWSNHYFMIRYGSDPSCHWARGRVHPGQVSSLSQGWCTEPDNEQFRVANQPNLHLFRLWEETGDLRGNPRRHREDMHTTYPQPAGRFEPRAMTLTTTPPCHRRYCIYVLINHIFFCLVQFRELYSTCDWQTNEAVERGIVKWKTSAHQK